MSPATRRRLVVTLVVVLAIWPLCHFFAMRALDLDPWNWFGWAMYTQPAERIRVSYASLDGEPLTYENIDARSLDALRRGYGPWSRRYLRVHGHAPPDELARILLEAIEGWEGAVIRIERIGLDRASARIAVLRTDEYRYRREDLAPLR